MGSSRSYVATGWYVDRNDLRATVRVMRLALLLYFHLCCLPNANTTAAAPVASPFSSAPGSLTFNRGFNRLPSRVDEGECRVRVDSRKGGSRGAVRRACVVWPWASPGASGSSPGPASTRSPTRKSPDLKL
jgi:hypothetical protein